MRILLTAASCILFLLLSGCMKFDSIDQPFSVQVNDAFTVNIEVFSFGDVWSNTPLFGVCLPDGWTVQGDSVWCTGVYNETIYYDSLVADEQENVSPAPEGYYWWGGSGPERYINRGYVYTTLQILCHDQIGCFSIDYMLGLSFGGINIERSDNHLIGTVDHNTPVFIEAVENDNSVALNWHPPAETTGLLGYNIYRDQQLVNTDTVVDTFYTDENAMEGAHYYAASALYDDGGEHQPLCEFLLFFGEYAYVSPDGDDSNDGSSLDNAFRTIAYAQSIIAPDSLHKKTIMLGPGVYSSDSNGEEFPVKFKNYMSVTGAGQQVTSLYGGALEFKHVHDAFVGTLSVINGAVQVEHSSPTIDNISVSGGYRGIDCSEADAVIRNNTIRGNSEVGIFCYYSDADICNNVICGNSAGGISCLHGSVLVNNNSIHDNLGCGIGISSDSDAIIKNNTISGNSDGGIRCNGNSNTIAVNSILRDNSGQQIYGSPIITYSDIQGGWEGEGNIDVDPLFRDPDNGDFHLMSAECGDSFDSPCIDAGSPAIIDSLVACSWGLGAMLSDMGAYGGGDSARAGILDSSPLFPERLALYQNYPNPFNGSTVISYNLPADAEVAIEIYDILGRRVETRIMEDQQAGYHQISWDARELSSGAYFYRIRAGEHSETRKMVLLK